MKGVELIASIIGFLVLFGISAFLGGIIITVLNLQGIAGNPKVYEMALSPIYPPIKYEDMLLSYLETTDDVSGFQMKTIIVHAAYQKNVESVFVNEKEVTSLKSTSSKLLQQWIGNYGYMLILNIDGMPNILADNRLGFGISPDRVLKLKRISIPTYIDSESFAFTNQEFPLDVTLDLYVQ